MGSLGHFFYCCPGCYFIGCLGRYCIYFIAAQGDISLVAWADILFISLLPRAIFHWLPGPILYLFHCCPGLYFIGCLGRYFIYFIAAPGNISLVAWADIVFISLLPRAIFHWLPGPIFYLFHCCLGRYFIGCLGDLFHCCPG